MHRIDQWDQPMGRGVYVSDGLINLALIKLKRRRMSPAAPTGLRASSARIISVSLSTTSTRPANGSRRMAAVYT
ncbi:MAG: hypothetical protein ACRECV_17315 [Xanthobacteraceae bacterium]